MKLRQQVFYDAGLFIVLQFLVGPLQFSICSRSRSGCMKRLQIVRLLSLIYLGMLSLALLSAVPDFSARTPQDLIARSLLHLDFYSHLAAFFVWGILASAWEANRFSFLAVVAIAGLLEFAQPLTSVRIFEITDLAANIAGTMIGFYTGSTSVIPRI